MSIRALDHVNIRTADLEATVAFFRDVLGMNVVSPPGAPAGARAAWVLDDSGNAVVHIGATDVAYPTDDEVPFDAHRGGGSVHHVAFRCGDPADMLARLTRHGVAMHETRIESIGLRQMFVHEPNGIFLELNFWESAQGAQANPISAPATV
jgi:catechol 2,3-dioxygenase-like lactoylglutathione lyase family enzyme